MTRAQTRRIRQAFENLTGGSAGDCITSGVAGSNATSPHGLTLFHDNSSVTDYSPSLSGPFSVSSVAFGNRENATYQVRLFDGATLKYQLVLPANGYHTYTWPVMINFTTDPRIEKDNIGDMRFTIIHTP